MGTEHYEATLSVETAADLISEIGNWLDEPLSDGSLIPTYMLARFVRHHVTVALGGDGGDELFAGYPMYYAHKVANAYAAVPSFIRSRSHRTAGKTFAGFDKESFVRIQGKTLCPLIGLRYGRTPSFVVRLIYRGEQELLLTPDVRQHSAADVYVGTKRPARDLRRRRTRSSRCSFSTLITTWPRTS